MSKTSVMTLRLAPDVARGVELLARRFGHKPAQVGARLVEEGLRRRDFPQIELRDTLAGRVAYLAGTRFTVYWIVRAIQGGLTAEKFAEEYELPPEKVRAALAYTAAYSEEIQGDMAHAEANRKWLENQQTPGITSENSRRTAPREKRKHKAAG
jgi:uncharacterized protein (DUF433 family)